MKMKKQIKKTKKKKKCLKAEIDKMKKELAEQRENDGFLPQRHERGRRQEKRNQGFC